jgi:23S rRNA (cytidine2498-2'-O)-methyltransferase
LRAYLVTPGFEEALRAELGSTSQSRRLVPGVVVTDGVVSAADPVFARQALPDVAQVHGSSVSALAETAYAALEAHIDGWAGPFTLHTCLPPSPATPSETPADDGQPTTLPAARLTHTRARARRQAPARPQQPAAAASDAGLGSRVALVGSELLRLLTERRRRASRRHVTPDAARWGEGLLLVQVLAVGRAHLLVSAASPRPLPRGGCDLTPWPGGSAPVALDRTPPSRAYRKLEEAFLWLGTVPDANQTCVDLGAAPGSWTLMALRRGARVVAVDRAPLTLPAASTRKLTLVTGNAFTYEPPQPVDWLLSDIVCEPQRAIALVDTWLTRGWCAHLVVTIKFKGSGGYGVLGALDPIFDRVRPRFARVKQLAHNKNEVTVMVSLV